MPPISADYLIALDRAQSELGDLYTVARGYRRLACAADDELLPALTGLGIRLRTMRRQSPGNDDTIAAAAEEMHALRDAWQLRLDEVRTSAVYLEACQAYAGDDQQALAVLLPAIFTGLESVAPPDRLHFGVRVSAPRRHAGDPPFLTAEACVARLRQYVREGLRSVDETALGAGDFACLVASDDPFDLDTPVSLVQGAAATTKSVFRKSGDPQFLLVTPRISGPFSVCLCRACDDAWWDASEANYETFRDEVVARLRAADVAVAVATPEP